MVVCLEHGADLHMAQLTPLLLTVSCFSKIQIGFTFLVPAHPGSPGKRAVKRVCVCVCSVEGANPLHRPTSFIGLCSKNYDDNVCELVGVCPLNRTSNAKTGSSNGVF